MSHPNPKRFLAAALAAIAIVPTIAACTATPEEGSAPQLTIALPSAPTSLDPSQGSGGQNSIFQVPAYQGLLHISGNADVVPSLADSFEWTDDTNTQLTVKLHPDLKFSDGTDLNADAVKTSIEHFKEGQSVFSYVAASIASIETPDPLTVVFNLSEPTPALPTYLAENTGMGSIISPQALDDGVNLGTTTVGAGPYVLAESETVQGSVYTYTPNEHYYDQDAIKFGEIEIRVIENANTALSALQSGQVDVAYGQTDTFETATQAGLSTVAFPTNINGLWLQDQKGEVVPALGDVRVRQALQYAVDRASIADAVTLGAGAATYQSVTPDSLGYDASLELIYDYDVAKAESLLAEAGYPDGFTMEITAAPGPDNTTLAQAIAEQFGKIGVVVNIIPSSTFPEYAQQQESGAYSGTVVGLGMQGMLDAMSNVFGPSALVNPRHTDFADVNAAAAAASSESGDAGDEAWRDVNRMTVEQALVVPVTTIPSLYYWADTVTGVDGSSMMNPVFWSPAE
ncbi:MAG: ABC transporter substrate-binding protein [Microbacterium sp.]|uniref:ABC transporter substrate-binding protein n=1 Tax=Microbacterium sp. TaxID=51671 RepID=UPI0039E47B3E